MHYKHQLLACDCFTVETLFLKTLYVFCFIELGSRRVHFAGGTAHPTGAWVTQQARQLVWAFEGRKPPLRFLIHDRDRKFTTAFDAVFASERIHIIRTPVRAPHANAYAERWVGTVREACLDQLIILNEAQLRRVMHDDVIYYNNARPHQGIDQRMPVPQPDRQQVGPIRCRNVLGILNDYYRAAA
jgi:transposase InsO family protein